MQENVCKNTQEGNLKARKKKKKLFNQFRLTLAQPKIFNKNVSYLQSNMNKKQTWFGIGMKY